MDKMNKTLTDTRMYRRIRQIKDSMLVMGGSGADALAYLVSSERRLLKEGVLHKACRAKNKPFQFWLFNHYLLYATPIATLGGSKYQFNRLMSLSECFLRESREDPRAFELLSGEKSFALWCETVEEARSWVAALRAAIKNAREAKGLMPEGTFGVVAAPLWVQESEVHACHVCHEAFGWALVGGRQKHHCRACGNVVCGSCSGYRMLLPNIHKTRTQRVCVTCHKGGKPVLELEDVSCSDGGDVSASLGRSTGDCSSQPQPQQQQPTLHRPNQVPLPTLHKKGSAAAADVVPQAPVVPPKKPARRASKEEEEEKEAVVVVAPAPEPVKAQEKEVALASSLSLSRPPPPPSPALASPATMRRATSALEGNPSFSSSSSSSSSSFFSSSREVESLAEDVTSSLSMSASSHPPPSARPGEEETLATPTLPSAAAAAAPSPRISVALPSPAPARSPPPSPPRKVVEEEVEEAAAAPPPRRPPHPLFAQAGLLSQLKSGKQLRPTSVPRAEEEEEEKVKKVEEKKEVKRPTNPLFAQAGLLAQLQNGSKQLRPTSLPNREAGGRVQEGGGKGGGGGGGGRAGMGMPGGNDLLRQIQEQAKGLKKVDRGSSGGSSSSSSGSRSISSLQQHQQRKQQQQQRPPTGIPESNKDKAASPSSGGSTRAFSLPLRKATPSPAGKNDGWATGTKRVGGMLDELVSVMQRRRELLATRHLEEEDGQGGGGEGRRQAAAGRAQDGAGSDSDSDGWED